MVLANILLKSPGKRTGKGTEEKNKASNVERGYEEKNDEEKFNQRSVKEDE